MEQIRQGERDSFSILPLFHYEMLDLWIQEMWNGNLSDELQQIDLGNRPFSYTTKEPGSSVIFIHFYMRGSIEWRQSFGLHCAHSKILQIVANCRSLLILCRIAKRSILGILFLNGMESSSIDLSLWTYQSIIYLS